MFDNLVITPFIICSILFCTFCLFAIITLILPNVKKKNRGRCHHNWMCVGYHEIHIVGKYFEIPVERYCNNYYNIYWCNKCNMIKYN